MKGWKAKLAPYGRLGLYIYLGTTCVSMVVFLTLLHFGFRDTLVGWIAASEQFARANVGAGVADFIASTGSLSGGSTTVVAAYAITKLIQVPRIMFTVAITPAVARYFRRAPAPDTADNA
jgi:hypothetical protein